MTEAQGAKRLVKLMTAKGWGIWKLGGGKFTVGWPDFYAYHPEFGERWIETKSSTGKLRPSQIRKFREMEKYGVKIYVCTDETDYILLSKKPNWREYIRW